MTSVDQTQFHLCLPFVFNRGKNRQESGTDGEAGVGVREGVRGGGRGGTRGLMLV